MLINLTNHPSANWSKEQLEASACFGEIVDYPFPMVSPEADEEIIIRQAAEIVYNIYQVYGQSNLTIHLMGEFTMTVALLKEFSVRNIPCIASTTERIVTETEPGKKSVVFKFVRFRKYL